MIEIKEGHEVEKQVESFDGIRRGRMAQGSVALGNSDGERLEAVSTRLLDGWLRNYLSKQLVQEFNNLKGTFVKSKFIGISFGPGYY